MGSPPGNIKFFSQYAVRKELFFAQRYHFIGIAGIGMSGLARLLLQQGAQVSGSDRVSGLMTDALEKEGAKVFIGHSKEQVPPGATVIYSSDIPPDNVEWLEAQRLQLPLMHRSQLLAYLIKEKQAIAVAGSHGKTTTTALLATLLIDAAWQPTYILGGLLKKQQTNGGYGVGQYAVFEADESDGTCLNYQPFGAILTNIDLEHMNHFGSEPALLATFQTFAHQVASPEHILWCADDLRLKKLGLNGFSYGFDSSADLQILDWEQRGWKTILQISFQEEFYRDIEIPLIGRHNALNAAAVFGMGLLLSIPEKQIRDSFVQFKGVKRRCDFKGKINDALIIDDYAHHPTEIKTTLEAIRRAVEGSRLIALFQPHRYTRTRDCLGMYPGVFDAVDLLVITDIYAGGEPKLEELSHEQVIADIRTQAAPPVRYIPRNELLTELSAFLQPGDILVTLGAGDITKVSEEIYSSK